MPEEIAMQKKKTKRSLNEMCSTKICVDVYREGLIQGKIFDSHYPEAIPFENLMQMLKKLETILDEFEYPQRTLLPRRFVQEKKEKNFDQKVPSQQRTHEMRGALATFHVKVVFRKNASWQGHLCWIEGEKEESFRSVLELLLLMDDALTIST